MGDQIFFQKISKNILVCKISGASVRGGAGFLFLNGIQSLSAISIEEFGPFKGWLGKVKKENEGKVGNM